MMRAMFAAISGLQVHQTMLDVTANDIANVNTVGYKGERTSFKDALSQLQRGATGAGHDLGGTNAAQVGLGVQLGSIDNQMNSGAIQSTGNPFDLAIQGDGWFRVTDDPTGFSRASTTRAPATSRRDANGDLVTQEGYYVVGKNGRRRRTRRSRSRRRSTRSASARTASSSTVTGGVSTAVATIIAGEVPERPGPPARVGQPLRRRRTTRARRRSRAPGATGIGLITPGAVEMSNVDLAQEFTNMITAQRGFQANSRVISAADEMLQELVNLEALVAALAGCGADRRPAA